MESHAVLIAEIADLKARLSKAEAELATYKADAEKHYRQLKALSDADIRTVKENIALKKHRETDLDHLEELASKLNTAEAALKEARGRIDGACSRVNEVLVERGLGQYTIHWVMLVDGVTLLGERLADAQAALKIALDDSDAWKEAEFRTQAKLREERSKREEAERATKQIKGALEYIRSAYCDSLEAAKECADRNLLPSQEKPSDKEKP